MFFAFKHVLCSALDWDAHQGSESTSLERELKRLVCRAVPYRGGLTSLQRQALLGRSQIIVRPCECLHALPIRLSRTILCGPPPPPPRCCMECRHPHHAPLQCFPLRMHVRHQRFPTCTPNIILHRTPPHLHAIATATHRLLVTACTCLENEVPERDIAVTTWKAYKYYRALELEDVRVISRNCNIRADRHTEEDDAPSCISDERLLCARASFCQRRCECLCCLRTFRQLLHEISVYSGLPRRSLYTVAIAEDCC